MKHRIVFDHQIDVDAVVLLAERLNQAEAAAADVDLYFSTDGGAGSSYEALKRLLDTYPLGLTIYCSWGVQSYGFVLVAETLREVEFLPLAWGAMHKISNTIEDREALNPRSLVPWQVRECAECNAQIEAWLLPHLSESERVDYGYGRMVQFEPERFRKIIETRRSDRKKSTVLSTT